MNFEIFKVAVKLSKAECHLQLRMPIVRLKFDNACVN